MTLPQSGTRRSLLVAGAALAIAAPMALLSQQSDPQTTAQSSLVRAAVPSATPEQSAQPAPAEEVGQAEAPASAPPPAASIQPEPAMAAAATVLPAEAGPHSAIGRPVVAAATALPHVSAAPARIAVKPKLPADAPQGVPAPTATAAAMSAGDAGAGQPAARPPASAAAKSGEETRVAAGGVELRVAGHGDYTRLVYVLPAGATFKQAQVGDILVLNFPGVGTVPGQDRPPENVLSIHGGQNLAAIGIRHDLKFHVWQLDQRVIVDIYSPTGSPTGAAPQGSAAAPATTSAKPKPAAPAPVAPVAPVAQPQAAPAPAKP